MSNYNYAIEKYLAERGGKADKDITRTCGNCESYDAEHWQCLCADEEEGTFRKKKDAGCYYHRTHEENERLKMLVKQRQDETNRLRLEEQRKNGTGDCAGCPFREMQSMLEQLVEAVKTLNAISLIKINDKLIEDAVNIIKKARRFDEHSRKGTP